MESQTMNINNTEYTMELFGNCDFNIKLIEKECNVSVINREGLIKISGEKKDIEKTKKIINSLVDLMKSGEKLTEQNVNYCITLVRENKEAEFAILSDTCICITASGRAIRPKTIGQREYCKAIAKDTITLGIGPAGTGKTYLAVAMAVKAFKEKEVNKIILTRPAVEAGESLGFLPGDLQQKIDPYLRPLYDALFDMFGSDTYQKHMERGNIEIAPLAYMRGRTLDDSFIILDEAQNTSPEQMKLFLTRLGYNSKMVITGDITQIDLPRGRKSGLKDAVRVLKGIDGISKIYFTDKDVVRNKLVQDIILAYERAYKK